MTAAVVISGSRQTEHRIPQDYDRLFAEFVAPFVQEETSVLVGGAKGVDSLALIWLATHTRARLVVVAPGVVAGQPEEAQAAIAAARESGRTEVVELHHPEFPSAAAYHARNRWMVDRAGLLIAFPVGQGPGSGTWYTIDYAAERGLPRLIVPT